MSKSELPGSEAWLNAIGATRANHQTQLRSYIPPKWCGMHREGHECAGGCWGVWHGFVNQAGATYCQKCEYFDVSWKDWIKPATKQEQKTDYKQEGK